MAHFVIPHFPAYSSFFLQLLLFILTGKFFLPINTQKKGASMKMKMLDFLGMKMNRMERKTGRKCFFVMSTKCVYFYFKINAVILYKGAKKKKEKKRI